jgi:hypothetical protein
MAANASHDGNVNVRNIVIPEMAPLTPAPNMGIQPQQEIVYLTVAIAFLKEHLVAFGLLDSVAVSTGDLLGKLSTLATEGDNSTATAATDDWLECITLSTKGVLAHLKKLAEGNDDRTLRLKRMELFLPPFREYAAFITAPNKNSKEGNRKVLYILGYNLYCGLEKAGYHVKL